MKWTLNINQQQAVALGIKNAPQAIIFGMICDAATWAEPVIIDGKVFYWTSRTKFVTDLPILNLKDDTVYRYFKSLQKLGLIVYKKNGLKDCILLTELGKTYYIGKKSEQDENTGKNPSKSGKKSEKPSEKNPTYTSSIHPSSSNSSSSKIVDEEESGVLFEIDPFKDIPESIDGIQRDFIIYGIEELAASNAGDVKTYRDSLIREVLSGKGRTIANIRKNIQKQRGRLPDGVNIFDIIGRDK